jgi:methyltransferase-like protein/SAM-dependent methyltransferase
MHINHFQATNSFKFSTVGRKEAVIHDETSGETSPMDNPVPETDKVNSYDEVPYESQPFPQSHPDRLATIARLFGMSPPAIDHCHVLELGCAGGGNLIPMAFQLPGSEFVGIDYSRRHVQTAQEVIRDLDLKNIRVEHGSILDVDATWGAFDYIICHGVYSWVTEDVQDKILSICAENLREQGVAYISYNTYPGWHMREMIRRMMIYHTDRFTDPVRKIQQARALIDFLARSVPTKDNAYGLLLKSELEIIKKSRDYYLFHDHLEEHNAPVYFSQFAENMARYPLQYLGEADFHVMLSSGFSEEAKETLKRIAPDMIKAEQYMDFLRNRHFRQTLICRKNVSLKRNLIPEGLKDMLIAANVRPEHTPVDLSPGIRETFHSQRKSTLQTDHPLTKAAFVVMKEHWPQALGMEALFRKVLEKLAIVNPTADMDTEENRNMLRKDLLQAYTINMVELHTHQPDFQRGIPQSPKLSPLATYQIAKGRPAVNQRHETVRVDTLAQKLAPYLDGSRNRGQLSRLIQELIDQGSLVMKKNETPVTPAELTEELLDGILSRVLNNLAGSALLV